MNRSARKFARDAAVTIAGTALLFVADNVASLGLPPEVVAFAGPVALLLYRILRDRFDVLARVDSVG